jgi:TonB family protein
MPTVSRATGRSIAVAAGLLVAVAAELSGRADSVVAPDERLPTLHCLHVFEAQADPRALCELVNDTSGDFFFDGDDPMTPVYAIERKKTGGWEKAGGRQESKRTGKRPLTAGSTIEFPARLPRALEPLRVNVSIYRVAGSNPIPLTGNSFRLPVGLGEDRDREVPVLLCHEILPPTLVHRVKPEYPDVAKKAGIQGTVVLGVTVGRDGQLQDVRVVRGIPVLDDAAVAAVKQWTYRLEHPVAVYFPVSVKFELPSEGNQ